MKRTITRLGNRFGVWLYRKADGKFSGGEHVVMITVPGRRSGVPRSTCVRYVKTAEGLVVWGTGSGSRTVPDWFLNLRAAGSVTVRRGAGSRVMRVRELAGDERESVWRDVVLAEVPGIARFAEMAQRTIPVAVLT